MVHEVAASGFGAQAGTYDRARPSYPPELVDFFVEHLHLGPGTLVLDLAAGTGKLTRLLTPSGADLIAVEPVTGMAWVLREGSPAVPLVSATAEALPVADDSLDAVTVAQAFHWFDAEAAFDELARVLRPGGRVGLVWNARDRSRNWVNQVWDIMDRVEKRAPWRDHDQWGDSALGERAGFGPLHEATFHHDHLLTPDDVVARVASVSHVAVLPEEANASVLAEIRELLRNHPDTRGRAELAIPYRVDAYWCERIPAA
ncbi:MAG TPA: class I SAM-dependent methyltransferase [Acidimicrobiia bacterium]|nr:class I SAM-dependent methyltransferase [Acidimicrobiia bacterium]